VSLLSMSSCPLPVFALHDTCPSWSSVHVLLASLFLSFIHNFHSNSSKAFEPLEPLINWPVYTTFFTSIFVQILPALQSYSLSNISRSFQYKQSYHWTVQFFNADAASLQLIPTFTACAVFLSSFIFNSPLSIIYPILSPFSNTPSC